MATPQQPKFDLKMLVMPVLLIYGRKIDFKDPNILSLAQTSFVTVIVLLLAMNYYIHTRVEGSKGKETKKIWIPPKAKPSLPFGLGPAPEPVEPKDFEETTYHQHESKLLKESVQQLLMSAGITLLMGFQFKIYMPFVMQSIMLPLNSLDSVLIRKYIMGAKKSPAGGNLYDEHFSQPTKKSIEIAEKLAAARVAGTPAIPAEEPRVVEVTEEDEKKEKTEEADNKSDSNIKDANPEVKSSIHDCD